MRAFCIAAMIAALAAAQPVAGQAWQRQEIATPVDRDAIPLNTGGVRDSLAPESWSVLMGDRQARNVAAATLTPFLPAPGKSTGAAIIVAPGGAFRILSMDKEGYEIAHALAARGIAAFVLKYRLTPTPADPKRLPQALAAAVAPSTLGTDRQEAGPLVNPVEDASAAFALVRTRARQWGVDPQRVGMMGFSAGAITTLHLALSSSSSAMPAFIAPIYGPMDAVTVPDNAPPMFAVLASDDPFFARKGLGLIDAWQKARKPVEFHLYQKGSHGFGLGTAGTTTQGWLDTFVAWLGMNGFLGNKP